jgi:transposase
MFSLNESIRYYLYPYPTDMRKGFYTLSGTVKNLMGMDVCDGSAFIFLNGHLDTMKILHMETGGLVIYHMKLEEGRFRLPENIFVETNKNTCKSSWSELVLMVQGLSLSGDRREKRWKPKEKSDKKPRKKT